MSLNQILLGVLVVMMGGQVSAQEDIFRKWKTVDDETGEARSIVEIVNVQGEAFGTILDLVNPPADDPDPYCDLCTDDRKDKRVIGMEIIRGLKQSGDSWARGTILDPENGKVYKCKLWVQDGKLKVRGYIAFLYRTQTWLPAD